MPRKGAVKRVAMYKAKLQPERVKQDLEARRQEMIDAQELAISDLATMEDRVRGVLADQPVLVMDYLKYHNFSREVFRVQKNLGGGYALRLEVALLVAKYVARKCQESVLVKIRNDVFAIAAPPPE